LNRFDALAVHAAQPASTVQRATFEAEIIFRVSAGIFGLDSASELEEPCGTAGHLHRQPTLPFCGLAGLAVPAVFDSERAGAVK
jgi:hypothetical protein